MRAPRAAIIAVASNEQACTPPATRVDLDELLKDVKPYSGGEELAIPGLFETDQEHAEFVASYRAERKR